MYGALPPQTAQIMNKLILPGLVGMMALTIQVSAQYNGKTRISGTVLSSDGKPVEGVSVSLKGTKAGKVTAQDGTYQFTTPAGKYTLVISGVGIRKQERVIEANPDQSLEIETIRLQENNQALKEFVVQDNRNRYKTDVPSSSLRVETPLLELPQNIQVVSKQLLNDQQIFDMLEGVTRNVSGVTKLEHWDNYARLNMRGSQIAAFRNGMNVQMPWGPLAEDMSMVESIEFVKGPAGFMMANGEPSGFYNVVTKKPTGATKGEATMSLGSFDTYRATTDVEGKLSKDGKLLYRVNLMGQLKGSYRDYEYNNRYSIVPVITYKFNDRTSLTAEYTYQYSRMSAIGSNYAFSPKKYGELPVNFTTAEPNLEPTNIKDNSIYLTLHHQLAENWKFTGQLAYFNFSQIGSSLWPSGMDSLGNMQRAVGIWDAFNEIKAGQFFVNGKVKTGAVTHYILGGLDMSYKNYMADWSQNYNLNGTQPFNIYNPVHGVPGDSVPVFDRSKSLRVRAGSNIVGQSYTGLYVQDEIRFLEDRIRLTLAGRYTTVKETEYGANSNDQKFTPRVGLSVSIDKTSSVYALYDEAFVPQTGTDFNGKAFDPITGNNTEAGVKKDWFNGRWNTTASVYRITKNNVLTADPEHVQFSVQLGQTQTQGVEFDLRGEIVHGLNLTLNYAYTDSKVTKDTDPKNVGIAVPGSTKHITNGWLSYRFSDKTFRGLGVSLGYQYQNGRSSWYVFDGTDQSLPDYFRMDGSVSWQSSHYSVALNVNNILNAYLYSGAPYGNMYYWQTEAPRNLRITVGYKF